MISQRKNINTWLKALVLMIILIAGLIVQPVLARNPETEKAQLLKVLARFPAADSNERDAAASSLLKLGSDGIRWACRMLQIPGADDDTAIKYALSGVAVYVNRPGAEKERQMFSKSIIKEMETVQNREIKAFLIRLLQRTGRVEAIKPLGRYLKDPSLCEPATQALLVIRTSRAEKALLKALDSVPRNNLATIIKALGEIRSRDAVDKIIDYADQRDPNLRQVTLFALANIGDPKGEKALRRSYVAASSFERSQAPSLYLQYARRQAEMGRATDCIRICRDLIKYYTTSNETNVQCSALSLIVDLLQQEAFSDVLAAVQSPWHDFRGHALKLASHFPGEKATTEWIKQMEMATPEVQAEIISMLGQRNDPTALPSIKIALKSENKDIRLAAIAAAAKIGGPTVLDSIIPLLQTGGVDEVGLIKEALLRFPADIAVQTAANFLEESSPEARPALIEVLSERQAKKYVGLVIAEVDNQDDAVRKTALKALVNLVGPSESKALIELLMKWDLRSEIPLLQDALVAAVNQMPEEETRAAPLLDALEKVDNEKKADLIRPLARIGGESALQTIVKEVKNEDPKIKTAAVYALANWPDINAMDQLLEICKTTDQHKYFYLGLQGLVRFIRETDLSPEKKFGMLQEIFSLALTVEDKRLILSGLTEIKTLDSLRQAALYMNIEELKPRAARVVVRIALPLTGEEIGLTGDETVAVLKDAVDVLDDEYEKERVKMYIEKLLEKKEFLSFQF